MLRHSIKTIHSMHIIDRSTFFDRAHCIEAAIIFAF